MNSFEAPHEVRRFDQGYLDEIRAVVAQNFTKIGYWHDGSEDWRPNYQNDSPLLTVLQPVTSAILTEQRHKPNNSFGIRYFVTIHDVESGASQNGSGWHIDSGKPYDMYVAADVTPTEFLVRAPGVSGLLHVAQQYQLRHKAHLSPQERSPAEIKSIGLCTYTPNTLTLVHMINQIHRSPNNSTGKPLPRTFIRATVLPIPILNND